MLRHALRVRAAIAVAVQANRIIRCEVDARHAGGDEQILLRERGVRAEKQGEKEEPHLFHGDVTRFTRREIPVNGVCFSRRTRRRRSNQNLTKNTFLKSSPPFPPFATLPFFHSQALKSPSSPATLRAISTLQNE